MLPHSVTFLVWFVSISVAMLLLLGWVTGPVHNPFCYLLQHARSREGYSFSLDCILISGHHLVYWLELAQCNLYKSFYPQLTKIYCRRHHSYFLFQTGAIEGQNFLNSGTLRSFSEQQIVDCCTVGDSGGCYGGYMDDAFEYINLIGGLESETDYPYRGDVSM